MDDYDYLFKMVIVGDSGVGKTNLFQEDTSATIGVDFYSKSVQRGNKIIKTQLWDTAGQERYRAMAAAYYRGSTGAIIVFDVTHRQSFNNLQQWINEIGSYSSSDMPILIIGNKCDLASVRTVSSEEAQAFAEQHNMGYIETSALTADNVNKAFDTIIDTKTQSFMNRLQKVFCKVI
ncbi:uncharacterized protein [Blastocystis hominis]|uniref:Uncharacterized protein n=1 Tax=Blastocystis hominis TaxID=12968 RepID=D8M0D6_BLAHO|nr:uncharacterized protein [Blastocystis hominis]CBK21525.2 unnamed protein product [Blastocystis hominis]|eukprot:XP_012895573.1 uncharacterized protein [Blastocystis hominis]